MILRYQTVWLAGSIGPDMVKQVTRHIVFCFIFIFFIFYASWKEKFGAYATSVML